MSQLVTDWKTHTKEAALARGLMILEDRSNSSNFLGRCLGGVPWFAAKDTVLLHRASAVASTSPRVSSNSQRVCLPVVPRPHHPCPSTLSSASERGSPLSYGLPKFEVMSPCYT